MEAKVYNIKGEENGKVQLPEAMFGLSWNADLVHQVVLAVQANARTPVAHAKDRSEQRGGGRKPWRQKGTGRARHGSRRSPIWRGGGVTHGPLKEKDYSRKVNKKMRTKALFVALSKKLSDGQILFVDNLDFKAPKTKDAKVTLDGLAKIKGFDGLVKKQENALLIALPENEKNTKKSFSNFGNVEVEEVRNLNPVDVLQYRYILIANPEASFKILEERINK